MAAAPPSNPPVAMLDEVARGDFLVRVYQHSWRPSWRSWRSRPC